MKNFNADYWTTASEFKVHRVITAAIIGGTGSVLGGGKFANGAASAAFTQMYNAENSRNAVSCGKGATCSFGGVSSSQPPGTYALKDNQGNFIAWAASDKPMLMMQGARCKVQGASASRIHIYGTAQDQRNAVENFGMTAAFLTGVISAVPPAVAVFFSFGTSAYMGDKLGMVLAPLGVVAKRVGPLFDEVVKAYDRINTGGTFAKNSQMQVMSNMSPNGFKKQQQFHALVSVLLISIILCVRSLYEEWYQTASVYGGSLPFVVFAIVKNFGSTLKLKKLCFLDYIFTISFMVGFWVIFFYKVEYFWMVLLGIPFYFFTKRLSYKILE